MEILFIILASFIIGGEAEYKMSEKKEIKNPETQTVVVAENKESK